LLTLDVKYGATGSSLSLPFCTDIDMVPANTGLQTDCFDEIL